MSEDENQGTRRPSYMYSYIKPEALQASKIPQIDSGGSFIYMRLPTDGGWAWVILLFSFLISTTTDGILLSIGHLLPEIGKDMGLNHSKTSLISSAQYGLYLLIGPIASVVINKLGFRIGGIIGALISSLGMFVGAVSKSYTLLLIMYGFCVGAGFGMIYSASQLIVGYYFERYRAIAVGISCSGSGFGTFLISPLNQFLVDEIGWRNTLMVHGGMCLSIAFMCFTFRPVPAKKIAATIVKEPEDESVESLVIKSDRYTNTGDTVSNISNQSILKKYEPADEKTVKCSPCCYKSKRTAKKGHVIVDVGPLYRDDIFYAGNIVQLPEYNKTSHGENGQTKSLHYALSVTKAPLKKSVRFKRVPKAIKDGFYLLFDTSILKLSRFQLILAASLLVNIGSNIPYLYSTNRAEIPDPYKSWILPSLGIMNVIIRICLGLIAFKLSKIDPAYIAGACLMFGGFIIMLSSEFGHKLIWFQFLYCFASSLSSSAYMCLRTVISVNLLGLEKLTNAFGITSLIMGIGIFAGTCIGGVLVDATHNFDAAFQFVGWSFLISGATHCYIPYIQEAAKRQYEEKRKVQFGN